MQFFEPKNLFIFDIETIPDDIAAFNLIGEDSADLSSLEKRREALAQYHLKITDGKNDFLRQPFHKVVAISFLVASIDYTGDGQEIIKFKEIRSGGDVNSTEKDLIRGFFATIDKLKPRIISFNGKGFDIPVLKYRAMKYGITGDFFHNSGNKYESYSNRYASNWHGDLLDVLSDFGLSARIKLNEVCSILDFPGKFGVDGSNVSTMFDGGQLEDIRNYCETDVLNTYLVYLRYILHTGKITTTTYNTAIGDILDFLKDSPHKHFQDFYTTWANINKGVFYL
ncbi:MAG: 3'-5' exonuclease [Alphaproteobacteria bacterium]|jgi:predicted PolB exonuclease-like 3'-5' exonuclease|nr:3'-5' exonuclease [Alphaproteobacteria bacterium]